MKGKLYFFLAIFWIVIVFTFFMVRLHQESLTIPDMGQCEYYSEWGYLNDYYDKNIDTVSIEFQFYEKMDTMRVFLYSNYWLIFNEEETDSVLISFDDLKNMFGKR